jgi:hypothetical protein
MNQFKQIEQELIEKLSSNNNDFKQFSTWSYQALEKLPDFDPNQIIRQLLFELPAYQAHQRGVFADYPFTIIDNQYFSINFFFWMSSHTSIHQHPFVGAFKVIRGSSWHLEYLFNKQEKIADWLIKGELELKNEPNELKQGDCQEILLGQSYIHQVLHKEKPTVTLLIKSKNSEHLFDYIYPNYAWHDRHPQFDAKKKLAYVAHYYRQYYKDKPVICHNMLAELFEQIPAHELFLMSYNYPAGQYSHEFANDFNQLFLQDKSRFDWYPDLAQTRAKSREFMNQTLADLGIVNLA